jgi:hypothetical protein
MKQVYRIDKDGFYIEPVILQDYENIPPMCVDTQPQDGLFKAKFINGYWVEGMSQDDINLLIGDPFTRLKKLKMAQLNEACNNSILSGFNHTINDITYHFSFDMEAQFNFQGAIMLFDKNLITEIEWTVTNNDVYERLLINKSIMDELTIKIFQHKDNNIKHLRNDLMPLVLAAKTEDELNLIKW